MSKLRVYTTRGSPPSTAVLATLAALELPCDEVQLDYMAGEHLSDEHEKRNPAKEIPVLEDNGFFLSESVAIMQYLCECHGGEAGTKLYPRDPKQRAIVNQRLAYNMSSFYKSVGEFSFGKMFGLPGDPEVWKNNNQKALKTLETIFSRQGTRFAAGDSLTIADISLGCAILTLDTIKYDLTSFPSISSWYEALKTDYPKVWQVIKQCCDDLAYYIANPPDKAELDKLQKLKEKK